MKESFWCDEDIHPGQMVRFKTRQVVPRELVVATDGKDAIGVAARFISQAEWAEYDSTGNTKDIVTKSGPALAVGNLPGKPTDPEPPHIIAFGSRIQTDGVDRILYEFLANEIIVQWADGTRDRIWGPAEIAERLRDVPGDFHKLIQAAYEAKRDERKAKAEEEAKWAKVKQAAAVIEEAANKLKEITRADKLIHGEFSIEAERRDRMSYRLRLSVPIKPLEG